jgi:hypothetical protein
MTNFPSLVFLLTFAVEIDLKLQPLQIKMQVPSYYTLLVAQRMLFLGNESIQANACTFSINLALTPPLTEVTPGP